MSMIVLTHFDGAGKQQAHVTFWFVMSCFKYSLPFRIFFKRALLILFVNVILFTHFTAAQDKGLEALARDLQQAKTPVEAFYIKKDIAGIHAESGDYDTYGKISQELLQIAQDVDNDSLYLSAYNNLGSYFSAKGDFIQTLEYYFKALEIAEKRKDKIRESKLNINIADAYMNLKNYKQALAYMRKTQEMLPTLPFNSLITTYVNINLCEIFLQSNNVDSAFKYLQIADKTVQKHKDDYAFANILYDYALIYDKQGNEQQAEDFYRKSIAFSDSIGDLEHLKEAARNYSLFLLKRRDVSNAKSYALVSMDVAKKSGSKVGIINAADLLKDIYKQTQQTDSAFYFADIKDIYRDSVFNETNLNSLHEATFAEQLRKQEIKIAQERYRSEMKMNALYGGIAVFFLLALLLWKNNQQKQQANRTLEKQKQEINFQKNKAEQALLDLQNTQAQLIQQEKMASLGELTAGIAHEIQNPLNFVNNFSELSADLVKEVKESIRSGNEEEALLVANSIEENLEKINHHGKRADSIVKSMLEHSRTSKGEKQPMDINFVLEEHLRLAYHGYRAKNKFFNTVIETQFDNRIDKVNAVPQDMGRVFLNLFSNAFYSVGKKQNQPLPNYEPVVSISTKRINDKVEICIKDNGVGIPKKIVNKIFQPFFTTKPSGEGTGLGLSLSYDIIKNGHGGSIDVTSEEGAFTEFVIRLPFR